MGEYSKQSDCECETLVGPRTAVGVFWQSLIRQRHGVDEQINLRAWFAFFLAYMALLAAIVLAGQELAKGTSPQWGTSVRVMAGMMFYLSLCCTFCPLPTTWLILAVGSTGALATLIGPSGAEAVAGVLGGWAKVAVVAGLGGLATTLANLNEYHVFTFLLRHKGIGKVRQSRLHDWAGKWFTKEPFFLLVMFCFVPVPVDVVRWLAISHRYSRGKFFLANMLGRGSRYALIVLFSNALELELWSIGLIQVALVLIAAKRVLPGLWAKRQANRKGQSCV